MDLRFLPAVAAIRSGSVTGLKAILSAQPGLASDRSSCSHPTLMQCLVLDGAGHAAEVQLSMAEALLKNGSPLDEPLVAAASNDNATMAGWLLDHGAAVDGSSETSGWTPLEESIYWSSPEVMALLLRRGAEPLNLRTAAALGRLEQMESFFDANGAVRTDRGGIFSPFESLDVGPTLAQQLLDNALAYAAMGGSGEAAALLLDRGAEVNAFPQGFHYRGSALHWAAIRGHRQVCELLLSRGANPGSKDLTIDKTPSAWARHDGHLRLATYLEKQEA